jgi:hypothetical protein
VFIHKNDLNQNVVILDPGEVIVVEMPGGNGETYTIDADERTITDEDGNNVTALAYYR